MVFPDDFLFGTANADHQVEAHDPEREDVWDLWECCQGLTARGRATDFWNRYEEDIAAAAAMGCRLFRFSTAWARVEIAEGVFDEAALAHYRRVAECVRGHGMKVMLTLHHFVWPVWLERDHGGMLGKRFPELFARYAERTAAALGDLVDYWITFNEPSQLTFGYIRPWWMNRYYMPPGLPPGTDVDEEAEAVGKLVPNLFSSHAAARERIKRLHPQAQVGVNPLVTGFPTWLQMIMDWGACHRGLSEAVFKFTTSEALVREKGGVDVVIAGITSEDGIPLLLSDPYLRTSKAVLVRTSFSGKTPADLTDARVGVVAVGNQPAAWKRDLPPAVRKVIFRDYREALAALAAGTVDAVYGDAFYLMPDGGEADGKTRFLTKCPGDESYAVAVPNGRVQLMRRVNDAVARLREELQEVAGKEARRPLSISEALFLVEAPGGVPRKSSRGLRKIVKRGRLRVGLRVDTPENGLELKLARLIAHEVLGNENALEIVELEPAARMNVLRTKSRWLNWAWRFWGTTSLIANANWWYLGMSGRLPEELCPREAVGAQDFVGLDYYWGLPTSRLHEFRSLEDAAHGRFLRAPVWPRGLYHALKRFHRWFPGQPLFVVENGSVPEAGGVVRKDYIRLHLAEVEAAIREGVPVAGYNLWSITSNREWGHPFDPNTDFGLYFIDLDKDPSLRRVPTGEVEVYREIILTGMDSRFPRK